MNTLDETNVEKTHENSIPTTIRKPKKPTLNGLIVPMANGMAGGGSTASMRDMNLLENIIDWPSVYKKYKAVVKAN